MKRFPLLMMALLMLGVLPLAAQTDAIQGFCETGGKNVATSGLSSTTTVQQSYPRCTVYVYNTGTTTLATLYKDKVSTPLANPFTANVDGSWLFFALNTARYDVTMIGGTAPNVFPIPQTLTDLGNGGGGGGGGGGCSTLGIPTTNGSVTGDSTSTNCGYNNRSTDTATVPAEISTFGYNLLDTNSGTDIVAAGVWAGTNNTGDIGVFIGDSAGQNNTGVSVVAIGNQTGIANGGDEVVAIGESAGKNNIASFSNFIGDNSGLINPGQGAAHYEDCMGYDTCRDVDGGGGYIVGIGAFSSSGLHTMHDVIGIGDAAANDRTGGDDIIGIGNGAAGGLNDSHPSIGINIIGIGQGAAGADAGNDVIAIGNRASQNLVGDDTIAIGDETFCCDADGGFGDAIAMGNAAARHITGGGSQLVILGTGAGNWLSGPGDLIAIGDGAGGGQSGLLSALTDSVFVGDAAGAHASGDNIIGIGNGGGAEYLPGTSNIVGVGNGAASGPIDSGTFLPTASPHDVVGLGNGAAGRNAGNNVIAAGQAALNSATGNTGTENIAIGDHANTANTTGTNNVVMGGFAGAKSWVNRFSVGNSNVTGSQNTWVGDNSGPNTATQLSNTTALGYQAANDASNQVVLGSVDVTQFRVPAVRTISGIGCLQTDSTGNITNTGSSCGGGGGSGTVTSFASPAGGWPTWLVPTVVNPTTTPSLSVVAGAIPNAALANAATTVNGVTCTLGSTCTIGSSMLGTVTSFAAPGSGWPSWLAPTVVNSTTNPALSVAASAIPNSALANTSLTINTVSCTLGGTCTIPSSGAVSSVANSDGTLTISPTTGFVVGSLNLAHANTWTAPQTLSGLTLSGVTGATQCLHVSSAGVVSGTGVDCGVGGGGSAWSALTAPTGNLVLSMGANTSSFVYGSATGAVDMFRWLDGASNTGTGILGHFTTASGSTETPWQADANGVGFKIAPSGALTGVGTSATHGFTLPTATALPTPIATMTGVFSDTSGNLQGYENGGSFSRLCTVGNLQCASSGGGGTPQYIAPQPIAGCGVAYVSALTYTVGACTYSINGVTYNSPLTNITLPAADPTNPEIDVIYVDTTSTVHFIQGAAAVTPQQPVVDPSTQLQLTFVLVPATATTPANTTLVTIFDENTEWTSAKGGTSSANVTLASTNNPYHGTIDTEFGVGGTIATTTYAQYTKPAAGTVTLGDYNNLIFYLRNKAAWAKTRSVTVQWFNGATALGTAIVLSNGAYGFDATGNITSYQQVSIPTSAFGIAGTPATTVRFTVTGSGANLTGFYLDLVTLQGGNGGVVLPTTLMNFKGAWTSTATYQPNDTVVSAGIGYVALAQNTNVAVTTSATWAPLAPAATACPTCVTSAAALTNNAVMIGGGSQASSTIGADTTTTHALFATAGAPAFRAIAAGDIPASLSSTTSVNGTSIPSSATLTQTIASGTSALGTSAISSGACATVVTTSATGVATTDVIGWGFNADPTSTTGYTPSANGMLTIISYPTANNVNYKVCNNTGSSITPGAVTLNWRILR